MKFHDGRPLTSRDVKWTFDSLLTGKIRSPKAAAYRFVDRIDAPDDFTVIFHLKEPTRRCCGTCRTARLASCLTVVEKIGRLPVGSGPFRFVSAELDKDVILERNDDYWGQKAHLPKVRFIVVPDTITRALELRKGSADVASSMR